jgi:O-antigen/teichoic acid export membrane protein
MSFIQSAFQGLGRLDIMAKGQVSGSTLRLIFTLIFFYVFRWGIYAVLWGTTAGFVVSSLFFLSILWKQFSTTNRSIGRTPYKNIIAYAIPLLVSGLAFYAYTKVDILILGYYATNTTEVGNFSIATSIFSVFLMVAQSIATAIFPTVSSLATSNENAKLNRLFQMLTQMNLIYSIPACLGIFILTQPFLLYVLPEYLAATTLLKLLSPLIIIRSLGMICTGGYLTPSGHAQDVARLTIIAAVTNVLLDLILIPPFGAVGSIVGTLFVHSCSTLVALYLVRVRLGINLKLPWKPIISGVIMGIVFFFTRTLMGSETLISLFFNYVISIFVYFAILYIPGGLNFFNKSMTT